MNVIQAISTYYYEFGVHLLEDDTGTKMNALICSCCGDVSMINQQVFSKWLVGEGKKPVSWATLAVVLDCCGLKKLAEDIRREKSK